MTTIPRPEHPRPDRMRESWLNLNGRWDFEIDNAKSGLDRKFQERDRLNDSIIVPFCPESPLSGVEHIDFMNAVWYRRGIEIPEEWRGKRILLHIDACDHDATVFVNGTEVGSHSGGFTPFCFDITDALREKDNYITVYAEDDIRSDKQFAGKQSQVMIAPNHFYYTRTTGIWQTVWLEAVEAAHVVSYRAYADVTGSSVTLETITVPEALGGTLTVRSFYEGRLMGEYSSPIRSVSVTVPIRLAETHLWEIGCGRLYDLTFTVDKDGRTDTMQGYFGLREVGLSREKGLQINGKTVFGRFVLDQGYNPEGIMTPPDDGQMISDIETAMACGFNGARLHQKVFEPRFLYHADRAGYMVWAETGNWGFDHTLYENIQYILTEWLEEIDRDFSHPSIIGWSPFNETWDRHGRHQCNELLDHIYDITKAIDRTRPCITASGSAPTKRNDVLDVHTYEANPEILEKHLSSSCEGVITDQIGIERQVGRDHKPMFVSEYGGYWIWKKEGCDSWSYHYDTTEEEAFDRLKKLTDILLNNRDIFAWCYTQLTDVERELNGVMTYDRVLKFPAQKYSAIFGAEAAIEKQ